MIVRAIRCLQRKGGIALVQSSRSITMMHSRGGSVVRSGTGTRLFSSNNQPIDLSDTTCIANPQTADEYVKAGKTLLLGDNPELYAKGESYLEQAEKMKLAQALEQNGIRLPTDHFEYVDKAQLLQYAKKIDPNNSSELLAVFKQVVSNLQQDRIKVIWLLERIQSAQCAADMKKLQTNTVSTEQSIQKAKERLQTDIDVAIKQAESSHLQPKIIEKIIRAVGNAHNIL